MVEGPWNLVGSCYYVDVDDGGGGSRDLASPSHVIFFLLYVMKVVLCSIHFQIWISAAHRCRTPLSTDLVKKIGCGIISTASLCVAWVSVSCGGSGLCANLTKVRSRYTLDVEAVLGDNDHDGRRFEAKFSFIFRFPLQTGLKTTDNQHFTFPYSLPTASWLSIPLPHLI